MFSKIGFVALLVLSLPQAVSAQAVIGGGGGLRIVQSEGPAIEGRGRLVLGGKSIPVDVSGRATKSGGFEGAIRNLSNKSLADIRDALPGVRLLINGKTLWLVQVRRAPAQ